MWVKNLQTNFFFTYKIIIHKEESKQEEQSNFYNELQEYFKNTSKEKILEDWNKSAEFDKIGITVEELIEKRIMGIGVDTGYRLSKQETVEEAAKNYSIYNEQINKAIQEAVKFGAEWQKEQDKNKYSEEEVLEIISDWEIFNNTQDSFNGQDDLSFKEWFEKFKK